MFDPESDRWPPVYDDEDLRHTINQLTTSGAGDWLYGPVSSDPAFCQADVIQLDSNFPYLNEAGKPAKRAVSDLWLIIGNTCDLARRIDTLKWTNLVPILRIDTAEINPSKLASLKRYRTSRQFFVPCWDGGNDEVALIAPLSQIITVHKNALNRATVLARFNFHGWLLFHSCLVRYLARDDGRND